MATIGGSSVNDSASVGGRVKAATFFFNITNLVAVFNSVAYLDPTQATDFKVTLSGTAGTLLSPAVTFPTAAAAGAANAGYANIEIKDSTATKFLYAQGIVYADSVTAATIGTNVYSDPASGGAVVNSATGGIYASCRFQGASNGSGGTFKVALTVFWQ